MKLLGYTCYRNADGKVVKMTEVLRTAMKVALEREEIEIWADYGVGNGIVSDSICIWDGVRGTRFLDDHADYAKVCG